MREWVEEKPVVLIDDSDVVKPEGYKFEALGIVRDGSESTDKKSVYKKGYHVTESERCYITANRRLSPSCGIGARAKSK